MIESIYTPLSQEDYKVTELLNRYRRLDEEEVEVHEEVQQSQMSLRSEYTQE